MDKFLIGLIFRQVSCPGNFTCIDTANGGFNCVGPTTFNQENLMLLYLYNTSFDVSDTVQFGIRTRYCIELCSQLKYKVVFFALFIHSELTYLMSTAYCLNWN